MGKYQFHDLFFNFGLSDKEYKEVRSKVISENSRNMNFVCIIGTFIFIIVSFLNGFGVLNGPVLPYVISALILALCFVLKYPLLKKNYSFLKWLIYPVSITIFGVTLMGGVYFNTEAYAISFICILVLIPLLFMDRPYRVIVFLSFNIVLFIILDLIFKKDFTILIVDVINALAFGIVSIVCSVYLGLVRVKKIYSEITIENLAQYDTLTKLYNRNQFEKRVEELVHEPFYSITCIYMDVNGLHEENNIKGHRHGDDILKFCALVLSDMVGSQNAYRVGGDEFVSFVPDMEKKEQILAEIEKRIRKAGYSVSLGEETQSKADLNVVSLLNSAEQNMFHKKKEYYKSIGLQIRNTPIE